MMENLNLQMYTQKTKPTQLNLHFLRVYCRIVTSVHLFGFLLNRIWKEVVTACLSHIRFGEQKKEKKDVNL